MILKFPLFFPIFLKIVIKFGTPERPRGPFSHEYYVALSKDLKPNDDDKLDAAYKKVYFRTEGTRNMLKGTLVTKDKKETFEVRFFTCEAS